MVSNGGYGLDVGKLKGCDLDGLVVRLLAVSLGRGEGRKGKGVTVH